MSDSGDCPAEGQPKPGATSGAGEGANADTPSKMVGTYSEDDDLWEATPSAAEPRSAAVDLTYSAGPPYRILAGLLGVSAGFALALLVVRRILVPFDVGALAATVYLAGMSYIGFRIALTGSGRFLAPLAALFALPFRLLPRKLPGLSRGSPATTEQPGVRRVYPVTDGGSGDDLAPIVRLCNLLLWDACRCEPKTVKLGPTANAPLEASYQVEDGWRSVMRIPLLAREPMLDRLRAMALMDKAGPVVQEGEIHVNYYGAFRVIGIRAEAVGSPDEVITLTVPAAGAVGSRQ